MKEITKPGNRAEDDREFTLDGWGGVSPYPSALLWLPTLLKGVS